MTVPIYNQIDYVFVPKRQVNLLTNARSYSGTATDSDHRFFIATSILSPVYNLYTDKNQQQKPEWYEVWKLANDESESERYKNKLNLYYIIFNNCSAFRSQKINSDTVNYIWYLSFIQTP